MMAKKLLILLAVGVFSLSLAGPGIAAGMGDEVKGTVTKIEGNTVTIKDGMGVEQTVEPRNPEALTTFHVGDPAAVMDGMLMKAGGAEPAAPAPAPAPAPGSGY